MPILAKVPIVATSPVATSWAWQLRNSSEFDKHGRNILISLTGTVRASEEKSGKCTIKIESQGGSKDGLVLGSIGERGMALIIANDETLYTYSMGDDQHPPWDKMI